MDEEINDKINNLNPTQKREYHNRLIDVCENKDYCFFYGAKDPINLPESDINTIKQNLYQEMFGTGRYFVK